VNPLCYSVKYFSHEEHEGNTKIHREEHIYFVFLRETSVSLCVLFLHEEREEYTKTHREEKNKTSVPLCEASVLLCEIFLTRRARRKHEDTLRKKNTASVFLRETSVSLCVIFLHEEREEYTKIHREEKIQSPCHSVK